MRQPPCFGVTNGNFFFCSVSPKSFKSPRARRIHLCTFRRVAITAHFHHPVAGVSRALNVSSLPVCSVLLPTLERQAWLSGGFQSLSDLGLMVALFVKCLSQSLSWSPPFYYRADGVMFCGTNEAFEAQRALPICLSHSISTR